MDQAAARTFAVINARALVSADACDGVIDLNQEIIILDDQRRPLDTVSFGETVSIVSGKPAGTGNR